MEPISKTSFKRSVDPALTIGNNSNNKFANILKLEKAGELLRNTSQYEKWKALCQRNDDLAVKMADILLKRHELLDKMNSGQPADRKLFDDLTQHLKNNNIFLLESSEIAGKKNSPIKKTLKVVTSDSEINKPESILKSDKIEGLAISKSQPDKVESIPRPDIRTDKSADITKADSEKINTLIAKEPFEISDDNFLLLNVNYKKQILGENLTGYGDSEDLFLPLGELTRILDFRIDSDAEKGIAKGWFISEDRKFSLDMKKNEVVISGKKTTFPAKSVQIVDDQIFVESKVLSKWFPVGINFDYLKQAIEIDPREKLPFQIRQERESALNGANWSGSNGTTTFPREYSTYKLFGPQYVDVNMGSAYTHNFRNNDDNSYSSYNIYSKGDIGKMSSEIYLAGNSDNIIDDSEFVFKRIQPDANLLGPLKATSIAAGDIFSAKIPLIGGDSKERGFSISNKQINRSRDFDTTVFEGSLPSGWDVEVYRNGNLMQTKRVGDEGKYYFDEMPIYYGINKYELIFYGPQGQKRVETKNINIGSNLLKKGTGEYNISLTEKNTNIYEPDEKNRPDQETPRINATLDYGINDKISMGLGFSSQETESKRYDYFNLNADTYHKGVRFRGDYITDSKGEGNAVMGLAQTRLGKMDLKFGQIFNNDIDNDNYSETNISASGTIKGNTIIPDIRTGLSFKNTERDDYSSRMLVSTTAASVKNISAANYLFFNDTNSPLEDSSTLDGNFQVSATMDDFKLNGRLNYGINPDTEIHSTELSGTYRMTNNLSSSLFVKNNMEDDEGYSGSIKFNWNRNNGKFVISPSISYDNKDTLTAMINFSTSLGVDPKTKKLYTSSKPWGENGAALVKLFNDKNNNSIFDEQDELLQGASIESIQTHRKAETDENGLALLKTLPKYKPTDIVLDKTTLADPFLEPKTAGISIIPRTAHVQEISIPVIGTGEIDGTIYKELKDSSEVPYTNARVQLIDENGNVIQETRSEYDGFYLFKKVPHGNYRVRIDPEELEKNGMIAETISDMNIREEDNVLSGNDIHLVAPVKEAEKIEPEQAVATAQADKAAAKDETVFTKQALEPMPETTIGRAESKKYFEWTSDETEETLEAQNEKFGLHLTSYRTSEKAIAGIDYLRKKYKDILGDAEFTVKRTHVSDEKGIWFRVFAGSYDDKDDAEQLKTKIKKAQPYCRVLSLDDDANSEIKKGVHLTSFRTTQKALLSIEELKEQYPIILKGADFSIKSVDLGPEMGKWKRVIAGNYSDEADAKRLAKRIKMSSPYGETMPIEENEEFGVHLASFRTCEKASRGLKILQKKFSSTLNNDDFSIRRVDLGEKGIWYRIFSGRFKEKEEAMPIMNSLKNMDQYAKIINLANQNIIRL